MVVYVQNNQTYYTLKVGLSNASWEVAAFGASFAGDISILPINQTVVGIQTIPVVNVAPTDGQALVYSQSQGAYVPQLVSTTPAPVFNSGWNTVYEIDYSALPSQTIFATTVIDTHTYNFDNLANGTIALTNGQGIVFVNNAISSTYSSTTRTALIGSVNIKDLFSDFDITSHSLRLTVYTTQSNLVDNQYSGIGFEYVSNPTDQYITLSKGKLSGFNNFSTKSRFNSVYTEDNDYTFNFSNNVLQCTFVNNSEYETRMGTFGTDFPVQDSINISRRVRPVDNFKPSISNSNDLRLCFYSSSQTNSSFTTIIKKLKLEVFMSGSGSGAVFPANSSVRGILKLTRDLGGTADLPLVVGFMGRNLSTATPNNGDSYVYNGLTSQFEPKPSLGLSTTLYTATTFTIANGDKVILIDTNAALGPITAFMPNVVNDGDLYYIKDCGGAVTTKSITINGNGKNIDNNPTFVMDTNFESIGLIFGNNKWNII